MISLSRLQVYGLLSTTIFISTIVNAFRQRSNFYAAAVYLSKSNACVMILWNQGIYQTVLMGKLLQTIFLGELRLIEVERLQERGWFAVTETLLALTIFKDEFESTFVLLFVSLLFLKVFHWLASDRIEAMEQSANVSRLAHFRMMGLLSLLWIADIVMLLFAAECILIEGPTVMIMFASEYMILVASVWATSTKYLITCIDMRREVQWEEKSIYIFYVDLISDFFKLVTYLTFFGLTLTFYGLPLNILRDVYLTLRSFLLRIRDLRRYRLATKNMDTLYPNATREEMEAMSDKTCIICREDMEFQSIPGDEGSPSATTRVEGEGAPAPAPARAPEPPRRGPNETPKKLPCGHVFHFHCLKSWLERQQSCPTCRRPVLPQEQPATNPAARLPAPNAARPDGEAVPDRPGQQEQALRRAQINLARNLGREAFGVIFPNMPFPDEAGDRPLNGLNQQEPFQAPPTITAPPPPTNERTPNAPIPPSTQAGSTAASTPTPAASTSTPTSRPSTSTTPLRSLLHPPSTSNSQSSDSPNPLARFSLPNLELPPTGESALYHPPPSFGNLDLDFSSLGRSSAASTSQQGYADIAYGAFPQYGGRTTNVPPPSRYTVDGNPTKPPNLEERIKQVRERMNRAGGDVTSTSTSTEIEKKDKGKGKAKVEEPSEVEEEKAEEKVKEEEIDEVEAEVPAISRRQAALLAAERRRSAQATRPPSPSSWIRKTDSLAPWSEAAMATPLPPSREPSPTPPTSRTETAAPSRQASTPVLAPPTSNGPVSLPRLIPLFDPANPAAGSTYPALASRSLPSLGSTSSSAKQASDEQLLNEADQLAKRGIEDRLRMLVGFQDRLEGLVDEMRTALRSPMNGNGVEEVDRKGKRKEEPVLNLSNEEGRNES